MARTAAARIAGALAVVALVGGLLVAGSGSGTRAAEDDEVTILFGSPTTLDPALQSDIGSAAFSAQLFESLTAFDSRLTLRPALARSWDVSDDGTEIVFHLRPGLQFSDGSPLTADDVVGSWLRVIDPRRPSQLSSLLLDVRGAEAYLTGATSDPDLRRGAARDLGRRSGGRRSGRSRRPRGQRGLHRRGRDGRRDDVRGE